MTTAKVKDIGNFRTVDIVRETFQLLSSNANFFLSVQLKVVLPSTIVAMALQYILSQYQSEMFPPPPGVSPSGSRQGGDMTLSVRDRFLVFQSIVFLPLVKLLGFSLLCLIPAEAVAAISRTAILSSVGFIYNEKSFTFTDVLRAIPRLWKRLFVTLLWAASITFSIVIVQVTLQLLPLLFVKPDLGLGYALAISLLPLVLTLPAAIYAALVFKLASGASILDAEGSSYGRAAIKKGWRLLKGRFWVALWSSAIISLLASSPLLFRFAMQWRIAKDLSPWHPVTLLFLVLYVLSASLATQLDCLAGGVMYVSFMAYHGESLSSGPRSLECLPLTNNKGYQPIDTTDEKSKIAVDELSVEKP